MRPKDLSEFSYGYALTDALIQASPSGLSAAPLFPSLINEGKKGGGYDVKLSFAGSLLYLQFKLSDLMERSSAKEAKKKIFSPPFFRMPLRSSFQSDQHAMLIELEASGELVFYATPMFNTAKGLDEAYLSQNVIGESCFFSPSKIGPLPDQKPHWVSFTRQSSAAYFCSEDPRQLDEDALMRGKEFWERLQESSARKVNLEAYRATAGRMREIVLKELLYGPYRRSYEVKNYRQRSYEDVQAELLMVPAREEEQARAFEEAESAERNFQRLEQQRSPPEQVAYLARNFFGCEVLRLERDGSKQKKD